MFNWLRIIRHIEARLRSPASLAKRAGVTFGDNCTFYIKNWGTEPFLIHIGSNVTIADGVKLLTHDGAAGLVRDSLGKRYQRYGRITIGNNVFIGANAIILPGVSIGSNVVIGAGAVVNRDIESDSINVGVPAHNIGHFNTYSDKIRATCASDRQLTGNFEEKVLCALRIQKRSA